MKWDWKFGLTFVATLAGVVVPIWLWQLDLTSKAIQVVVSSSTPLFPSLSPALELKVIQGADELKAPVLSVIEVTNSGGRPILSSDFESPISVGTESGSIRRAALSDVVPSSLMPSISVEQGQIYVKPLLLNPGDKFKISVLTEGAPPNFTAKARIAGVKGIQVDVNQLASNKRLFPRWVSFLVVGPLVAGYFIMFLGIGLPRIANAYEAASRLIIGVSCMVGAGPFLRALLRDYELEPTFINVTLATAYVAVTVFITLQPFRSSGNVVRFPARE